MKSRVNCLYLIYPYYENPEMLRFQIDNWNSLQTMGKSIHIIVVDDASPRSPAHPLLSNCIQPTSIFRVMKNIPWGQHHARNIGAWEARKMASENPWMFLSDMDIVLPQETLKSILEMELDTRRHHTFERAFPSGNQPPKFHKNTFLVKSEMYWMVNGYDCDYCGTYGGDSQFLSQLNEVAPQLHHGKWDPSLRRGTECTGCPLTLFGFDRHDFPDACTLEWDRDSDMSAWYRRMRRDKTHRNDTKSKRPIRWQYEQLR